MEELDSFEKVKKVLNEIIKAVNNLEIRIKELESKAE